MHHHQIPIQGFVGTKKGIKFLEDVYFFALVRHDLGHYMFCILIRYAIINSTICPRDKNHLKGMSYQNTIEK